MCLRIVSITRYWGRFRSGINCKGQADDTATTFLTFKAVLMAGLMEAARLLIIQGREIG